MKKWNRVKSYVIKEISEDGLLKDPKNRWGEREFSHGYDTEDNAFRDLERFIGDSNEKYAWGVSFVVLTEFHLELVDA